MATKIKKKVKKRKLNNYDSVVYCYIASIRQEMNEYMKEDVVYMGKYKMIITMIEKNGKILMEKYAKKGYATDAQKSRSIDYAKKFYKESKKEIEGKEKITVVDAEEKFIPLIDVFMSSLEEYIKEFEEKIDVYLLREIQTFSKYCRRFLTNFVKLATGEEM